jgi:hypothetical protein
LFHRGEEVAMTNGSVKLTDTEPVAVVAAITNAIKTLVLAVIALALAFNWVNWSDGQNAAVIGVVAAAFVLVSSVGTIFTRQKVTPVAAPMKDGKELVKKQ